MKRMIALLAAASCAVLLGPATASAQAYPNKALRMIVPFPAGGGVIEPANMPRDVVQRLNKEIVENLKQKDTAGRLLAGGTVPTPSTPKEFTAHIRAALKKWGDVVKTANITAD